MFCPTFYLLDFSPFLRGRKRTVCITAGIVEAAAECLDPPKKLWMLGGVTALDVPGSPDTSKGLNDLPILYRTPYRLDTIPDTQQEFDAHVLHVNKGLATVQELSCNTTQSLGDLESRAYHLHACRIHTENYGVLLSDIASSLDWSMMCPGAVCRQPLLPPAL